jgi:hypothetical protein
MEHTDIITARTPTDAQRGTLTYMKPDFSFRTVEGWFYLNGGTVVMRKIRGRNHFNLCAESAVHDFIKYDAVAEALAKGLKAFVVRTNNQ